MAFYFQATNLHEISEKTTISSFFVPFASIFFVEMDIYQKYEPVIGLEVHIQLLTQSKAYSSESTTYGNTPNTNVGVVSLGHPGTLPVANEKVIEFAVKLGLAVGANIREENQYARKNYFYADLPKGYQITQDKTPICTGGSILINTPSGPKSIALTRIHMEEDAGKSMHDVDPNDTLVDLNRAGVPLLEMVSEPEIASAEEAYQYLTEVRKLVRYLEICDGNMEEGSMRCDANVSVRLKGVKTFGNKVEVKNMNSIRNVQRAIEYEIKRQIEAIENGQRVAQDTRNFDAASGTTTSMRSKEDANDYRYFPEPDLLPVIIHPSYISAIQQQLPALPNELIKKYTLVYGLSDYDATQLTDQKQVANYFNKLVEYTANYKGASNWVMGPVRSYLNERAISITEFELSPQRLAELITLVDQGKLSNTAASQEVFPVLIQEPNTAPFDIATRLNVLQDNDENKLAELVQQAIAKFPDKVLEYKQGKVGLLGLFMGEVMKLSKGKADPKKASELVTKALSND